MGVPSMRFPHSDKRNSSTGSLVSLSRANDSLRKTTGHTSTESRFVVSLIMCAFFNIYDYPFKWIKYLVVVTGVYTFAHWILTVPLLYSYFYECCNRKWPKSWIIWFLSGSFVVWLLALVLIFLIWCCLRVWKVKQSNESNVRLTVKKDGKGNKTESARVESQDGEILPGNEKTNKSKTPETEILSLPEFDSEKDFAVLRINDVQIGETPPETASRFPIPIDETRHYVQKEIPGNEDKPETLKTPPKTPREIFFKDLIEAANNSPDSVTSSPPSYFDFDPKKITEDLSKKYDLDKFRKRKSESESSSEQNDRNTFLLADNKENETLTSEVFVALDGRGVVVDEPVVLGRFQVLKE